MAIAAELIAELRRQYNCQDLLLMVQLEQVCPGFWMNLLELSAQLGCDRSTFYRSLKRLRSRGLICYTAVSNNGGAWIWWVKRHQHDKPNPDNEPAYVICDTEQHKTFELKISQRFEWADDNAIPRETMRNWLMGCSDLLRKRWRLVSLPTEY